MLGKNTGTQVLLVVDENRVLAKEWKQKLEQSGYRVCIVHDGRKALSWMKERKTSLVISDILLPEMDGFEICSTVKGDESFGDVAVMLLPSLSTPEEIILGLECGADGFIIRTKSTHYLVARNEHMEICSPQYRLEAAGDVLEKAGIDSKMLDGRIYDFSGKYYKVSGGKMKMFDALLSFFKSAVPKTIN